MLFIILLCAFFTVACTESNSTVGEESKTPSPAPSETTAPYKGGFTKEQRVSDAQMIIGFFERGYAPREWKEELTGKKFEDRSLEFLKSAGEDISDVEFYNIIARFVYGFHDAHTTVTFPSSAVISLPIGMEYIDGHVVVTYVDDKSEDAKDAIKTGDEIISFGGKPVLEAVKELLPNVGAGNHESELKDATSLLSYRPQRLIPILPREDSLTIGIRSNKTGKESVVTLTWKKEGYEFAELNDPGVDLNPKSRMITNSDTTNVTEKPDILQQLRIRQWPLARYMQHSFTGNPLPFFPLGATFIERKKEPYYTGIFVEGEKKIGFIRIQGYAVPRDLAFEELEEEISYLEKNTDALILDQTKNTGGAWCFTMGIASFFFDKPFKETSDQWRANRDLLSRLENLEKDGEMDDNDKKILKQLIGNLRGAMKTGKLLTDPMPICAFDGNIEPYKNKDGEQITYTKPVLIIVDELAVSGGDYFPALMQDTGRAVIFGAPTMGGGGTIETVTTAVGYSEINISRTISLGWREPEIEMMNGKKTHYLEGVGTIPDIEYKITMKDIKDNYKSYREAALISVMALIPSKKEMK